MRNKELADYNNSIGKRKAEQLTKDCKRDRDAFNNY